LLKKESPTGVSGSGCLGKAKKKKKLEKIESQSVKKRRHVSSEKHSNNKKVECKRDGGELLTLKGKLNCAGSHGDDRSWTRSTCSALAVVVVVVDVDDGNGSEWAPPLDGEEEESGVESVRDE
jgi:hypothetical protein